jgi:type I restriction enzyme S subunit
MNFYRVADYNKFGLNKPDKKLTNDFVKTNLEQIEKLKPKKGTILFSKDGSVGTAYLLRENLDGITSGATLQLIIKNSKEIIPEYLTLVLNSKLVQMQAERDSGGSIILHWRKEEIENVVVPVIDFSIQKKISDLIEQSFQSKIKSENILNIAKSTIEISIEKSELDAIKYIKDNV